MTNERETLETFQNRFDYGMIVSISIIFHDENECSPWISVFDNAEDAYDFWRRANNLSLNNPNICIGIDSGHMNSASYLECLEMNVNEEEEIDQDELVEQMEERGYHYDDTESYCGYLRFYAEPPTGLVTFESWLDVKEWMEGVCE